MCTAIAHKGNDLIYGFNLDIDPAVWDFSIHKTKSFFALAAAVGKTTYCVHGVNRNGNFSNTPYMNGEPFPVPRGTRRERIDLMSDRYVRGKYTFGDIEEILRTKTVTCIPAASMHSLIGNSEGDLLIVEPGYGYKSVEDNFAVLTNFPCADRAAGLFPTMVRKGQIRQSRFCTVGSRRRFFRGGCAAAAARRKAGGAMGYEVFVCLLPQPKRSILLSGRRYCERIDAHF